MSFQLSWIVSASHESMKGKSPAVDAVYDEVRGLLQPQAAPFFFA